VKYVRCMVSRAVEDPVTRNLSISYVDQTGEIKEEEFDMVVLSVGMVPSAASKSLGKKLGIELDPHGFAATSTFSPLTTSRPGIYVCGVFQDQRISRRR